MARTGTHWEESHVRTNGRRLKPKTNKAYPTHRISYYPYHDKRASLHPVDETCARARRMLKLNL